MTWRIHQGDSIDVLRKMRPASIQCVVTSPPYWGLRDYGTAVWSGGDPRCKHKQSELRRGVNLSKSKASTRGGAKKTQNVGWIPYLDVCETCGAKRDHDFQMGLEPTLKQYVTKMVELFREIRRVLREDGTVWLNLGDTYAAGTGGERKPSATGKHGYWQNPNVNKRVHTGEKGIKTKDLVGIPWRVALALQEDGWYLRQDIIWAKPNPMPESCTDRCTKSHEYIFLLTKNKRYFYDMDAISEPCSESTHMRISQDVAAQIGSHRAYGGNKHNGTMKASIRQAGINPKAARADIGSKMNPTFANSTCMPTVTRNKRSVWNIATEGYEEAHFATFPTKLVEPCILAGTSEIGCCPKCGAPWKRVTKNIAMINSGGSSRKHASVKHLQGNGVLTSGNFNTKATVAFVPQCAHVKLGPVPCRVLDPFNGSGTTGLVAVRLGRSYIGIDLNPEYIKLAKKRIRQDAPLFNQQSIEDVASEQQMLIPGCEQPIETHTNG